MKTLEQTSNMLPKSLEIFTILLGCSFAIAKSQILAQSNFPYSSSFHFDTTLSGTTYLHNLPVLSSSTKGTSVIRFPIIHLATGAPSSPSAIAKLATRSSVPQPATTGFLTYSASPSASTGSATGPSVSQPATNAFETSSPESQPANARLVTRYSEPQSQFNTLTTGFSTPQQSVLEANGIQQTSVIPTLTDPVALHFANSFFQALVTSERLKNFVDLDLNESRNLFFSYGHNILSNAGISDPHVLADVVAQAVESLDKLSLKLYFTATANTLAKFLFSKHLLTADNEFLYYQKLIDLIEKYSISDGIHSTESIFTIVADIFFEFLSSIGRLNSIDDYVQLFPLFAQELKA